MYSDLIPSMIKTDITNRAQIGMNAGLVRPTGPEAEKPEPVCFNYKCCIYLLITIKGITCMYFTWFRPPNKNDPHYRDGIGELEFCRLSHLLFLLRVQADVNVLHVC